jgi:hypothetical protein
MAIPALAKVGKWALGPRAAGYSAQMSKGLSTRMLVGGMAGAILGDNADGVLYGATIGALAPGAAGINAGTVHTLGKFGSKAKSVPWGRILGGGTVAMGGYGINAALQSETLNEWYGSYYGDTPATQRTLSAVKATGTAVMVTGMIGGGSIALFGGVAARGTKAGYHGALAQGKKLKDAPEFFLGSKIPGTRGLSGRIHGGYPGGAGPMPPRPRVYGTTPTGEKLYSPMSRMIWGERLPARVAGSRAARSAGRAARRKAGVSGSFRGQSNLGWGSAKPKGPGLGRRASQKINDWRKAPLFPTTNALGRGTGKHGRLGGPNKLGAVGRHPYWASFAAAGAIGGGAGMYTAGSARQYKTLPGRIIGIDSGVGGGMNPALNFSTQGLGQNIHNRRRRRRLP